MGIGDGKLFTIVILKRAVFTKEAEVFNSITVACQGLYFCFYTVLCFSVGTTSQKHRYQHHPRFQKYLRN